jgi:hypothetical protein
MTIDTVDPVGNEVEYTPPTIEQQALDQGWKPREEYEGDPDKWVSADIFVARKPLFEHISSQKKELNELRKALKSIANTQGEIRKQEFDKALQTLKAAKREALLENDADRVIDIDDKIDLVKTAQKSAIDDLQNQVAEETQQLHPEMVAWVDKNQWYQNDEAMRAWADVRGRQLSSGGKTPEVILKEISKEVREKFPNEFKNQNRDRASAVESSTSKTSSGSQSTSLSDLERQIMRKVVGTGVMTEKEYMAQLKASR